MKRKSCHIVRQDVKSRNGAGEVSRTVNSSDEDFDDDYEDYEPPSDEIDENQDYMNENGLGHVRRLGDDVAEAGDTGRPLKLIEGKPPASKKRRISKAGAVDSPSLVNHSSTDSGVSLMNATTASNLSDSFLSFSKKARRLSQIKGRKRIDSTRSYFDKLPNEVILKIFSYLTKHTLAKCAATCKRLRRICYDDQLWKRVDMGSKTLGPGIVGQVLARGTVVMRLAKATIVTSALTNEDGFRYPVERGNKLRYLDLSMASMTVSSLEELMSTCHNLVKLALENVDVSDAVCASIAQNDQLDTLHLGHCQGLTGSGIKKILSECRGLEELNLGWTNLSADDMDTVCGCLPPGLVRLNLSGCRDNLTDDRVYRIVSACPRLVELDISDATGISNKSIVTIVEKLKSTLESLSASRCYNVIPATFLEVTAVPGFKHLNVFGSMRDQALAELNSRLPNTDVNKILFSSIARPTVGVKRTSIWGIRVRDNVPY